MGCAVELLTSRATSSSKAGRQASHRLGGIIICGSNLWMRGLQERRAKAALQVRLSDSERATAAAVDALSDAQAAAEARGARSAATESALRSKEVEVGALRDDLRSICLADCLTSCLRIPEIQHTKVFQIESATDGS